jgi:hypothetical protein
MLAVPQLGQLVAIFPPWQPRSGHVGFVDKAALRLVFSEYFSLSSG